MSQELIILTITAVSVGFFHTLFGPDHYLPFVVMAKARKWSLIKTSCITFLCGVGHIGSSVLLGMIGVALGIAVTKLEFIESFRGNLAAWALIAFGLVYLVWGLRRVFKKQQHGRFLAYKDEVNQDSESINMEEHPYVNEKKGTMSITPWILFTIFVLGPCEPLIPILMYPAAKNSIFGLVWVTAVFGGVTILTMLGIVIISTLGISLIPVKQIEKYTHALAGGSICLCGMAIQFLGL